MSTNTNLLENFEPLKGYVDLYSISKDGRVYSHYKNKLIYGALSTNGYVTISLRIKKRSQSFLLHRLVALQFIENTGLKPCINHKNGIKTDNTVKNLEWCTHAENNKHAFDTGLNQYNNPTAKLDEECVARIKSLIGKRGVVKEHIAIALGVSVRTVRDIMNGYSWKSVEPIKYNPIEGNLYRSLSIFPKVIQERELSEFTELEKEKLTAKGFRWKIKYSEKSPDNKEWKNRADTFKMNRDYKKFDERYLFAQECLFEMKNKLGIKTA